MKVDWPYTQKQGNSLTKNIMYLNPQDKRSTGRPRDRWKGVREKYGERSGKTWTEIKKLVPRGVERV